MLMLQLAFRLLMCNYPELLLFMLFPDVAEELKRKVGCGTDMISLYIVPYHCYDVDTVSCDGATGGGNAGLNVEASLDVASAFTRLARVSSLCCMLSSSCVCAGLASTCHNVLIQCGCSKQ